MGKIKIIPHTKNYVGIPHLIKEIKSDFVPRVGEIIEFSEPIDGVCELFVFDVIYSLDENDNLTPVIKARNWLRGDRALELQEQGWLPS